MIELEGFDCRYGIGEFGGGGVRGFISDGYGYGDGNYYGDGFGTGWCIGGGLGRGSCDGYGYGYEGGKPPCIAEVEA